MILADREINAALEQRRLFIHPRPRFEFIDSTAIDLTLDSVLDRWEFPPVNPGLGQKPLQFCPGVRGFKFTDIERQFAKPLTIPPEGYPLPPVHLSTPETGAAHFVLGWTAERICLPHTSRLCARVEGKSSLGRMGLGVHVTAPTVHAGFGYNENSAEQSGTPLRLEIFNLGPLPLVLTPGMRICQLILEEVREVPSAGLRSAFNLQGPAPKS
ncbi:MAG: hypothetical protein K2V38_05695 [Gemmataceae bacterium]|nr:hypothetical protein [Gemmataceae bacterium]